jgi:phosphate transport system permease protein
MTASAPAVRPEGGAGHDPLPRRAVASLRAGIRNGQGIRWLGAAGAVLPALALAFILVVLVVKGWPAIRIDGTSFFTSKAWSQGNEYALKPAYKDGYEMPPGASYGALPLIVGTLATSLIALIIAVPVAIGTALAVVERLPRRMAYVVGLFLEVLAGMPSVIIGLFGAVTLGPIVAHDIAPYVARNIPDVPVLSYFRGATGSGYGLLTSGLVLALMVIPIIAATTRDLVRQVPILPREGALALGMSDAQCARKVTLPWVGAGIVGSVVLGLGRALGETMAVAMVCGASFGAFPSNLYDTMITAAAAIVLTLEAALTDATGYALSVLAEIGLVLMIITLLTNIAARVLVRRVSTTALPVGAGI